MNSNKNGDRFKFIDFLNIGNGCNLNCKQCFFQESSLTIVREGLVPDIEKAKWLMSKFKGASFFLYPMEITTSMEYLEFMSKTAQQDVVLSNGILLTKPKVEKLIEANIKQVKITLFANYAEHTFFNNITNTQYRCIIDNIRLCKQSGLTVIVNTILSGRTKNSIKELSSRCDCLGVDKIEFIRLKPVGSAKHINVDNSIWLKPSDMIGIIKTIEECKVVYPNLYFSYNLSCGPDFYGKTIVEAKKKISKAAHALGDSTYLCPAIDGRFAGISFATGRIYGCFFAMDQKDFLLGNVDFDRKVIKYTQKSVINAVSLRENLRGNCNKNKCQYQHICLGGCRSTAYIFAKQNGDKNPMFAGMDICITNLKEKL